MEPVEKRRGPWSDAEDLTLMRYMHQYTSEGHNQTDACTLIAELHLPQRTVSAVASRFSTELKHEYTRSIELHKMLEGQPAPIPAHCTEYDAIIHVLQHKAQEEKAFQLNHKTLQEHYDIRMQELEDLQEKYNDLQRRYDLMKDDHSTLVRILRSSVDDIEKVKDSDEF